MQPETRQRLELIVERGKRIESYNFAKFYRENGIQTNLSIKWHHETGGKIEFSQNAPDEESITALAANLRFFTQPNEGICLYSDSWVTPRTLRRFDWVDDPALSQEWLNYWNGVQRFIMRRLASPTLLELDGVKLTLGMVYDVILYGDVIHSTKAEQLKKWRSNPIVNALVTDALYGALSTALDGIRKLTQVTQAELEGRPITPWHSLFNTRYAKRRRRAKIE